MKKYLYTTLVAASLSASACTKDELELSSFLEPINHNIYREDFTPRDAINLDFTGSTLQQDKVAPFKGTKHLRANIYTTKKLDGTVAYYLGSLDFITGRTLSLHLKSNEPVTLWVGLEDTKKQKNEYQIDLTKEYKHFEISVDSFPLVDRTKVKWISFSIKAGKKAAHVIDIDEITLEENEPTPN